MYAVQALLKGPTMVIGRRCDVWSTNRKIYLPDDVEYVAAAEGKMHPEGGIDYFAIADNLYPWHRVPDLVIGRPRYDNFLVSTATRYSVSVVDATRTIVALHQTDMEGIGSGHRHRDVNYNQQILRKYTSERRGCWRTSCTRYLTKLTGQVSSKSNATLLSAGRTVVVVTRSPTTTSKH